MLDGLEEDMKLAFRLFVAIVLLAGFCAGAAFASLVWWFVR